MDMVMRFATAGCALLCPVGGTRMGPMGAAQGGDNTCKESSLYTLYAISRLYTGGPTNW